MASILETIRLIIVRIFENRKGIEPINGRFRVMYRDGRISQRMYFKNAVSYATIFKGEVIYDDNEKTKHIQNTTTRLIQGVRNL